jgi:hypothetical protein
MIITIVFYVYVFQIPIINVINKNINIKTMKTDESNQEIKIY